MTWEDAGRIVGDRGPAGKDAAITKAQFDALEQRLKAVEARLKELDGLPYDHDSSIEIK